MMRRSSRRQPQGARRNQSPNPQPSRSFTRNTTFQSAKAKSPATSPDVDEYLDILGEALKEPGAPQEEDADQNGAKAENEVHCTCRRKQHVRSSKKMYLCEDPECTIQWYHDICLSPSEKEMVTKAKEWICSLCFDRRRARRNTSVHTQGTGSSARQPSQAAKSKGKSREHVPRTGRLSAMEAAAKGVLGPTNSQTERLDPWAILADVKKRVQEKYNLAKDKDSPRWQPNSELSFEEKAIKVDNLHEERNTWFWHGESPEDTIVDTETGPRRVNAHLATFVDTETGLERVLPQVGGNQVSHDFANDNAEKKRVSLEAAARRVTNRFTPVERGCGKKKLPVFRYQHARPLGNRELTGPIVVFTCDSYQSKLTQVEAPIRLLAMFSGAFEQLADMYVWDPPENEIVGRMTLPGIDRPLAKQVIEYLKGEALDIRARDKMGKSIDARNLSRAVQASSMAHLLDMEDLQRAAVHALWHFLVLYRHLVKTEKLQAERDRAFPGSPAKLILDECLRRQDPQNIGPLAWKIPTGLYTSTGLTLAKKVVETASCPLVDWKWDTLTPAMWTEVCKNRQLRELWKTLGPLVKTRRSFIKERLRITNADPFWRRGGARGVFLGSEFPPDWPRISDEELEREKKEWLDAEQQRLSSTRRLKKDLPTIDTTTPAPEGVRMTSTTVTEPESSSQPVVLVDESATAIEAHEDQRADVAEGSTQVKASAGAQAGPKAVTVDEDLFEISKEDWESCVPSQKNPSASGRVAQPRETGVQPRRPTGDHPPSTMSIASAPRLDTNKTSALGVGKSNTINQSGRANQSNHRGDPIGSMVVDRAIMFYLSHIVRQVREARLLPSFDGIDIMMEVSGSKEMTAIALTKFSEKYERAMNERQASISMPDSLEPEGLSWTAEYLHDLCRNAGKPSKVVPLAGVRHALHALEVANALQISRVQSHLLEWLKDQASKAS